MDMQTRTFYNFLVRTTAMITGLNPNGLRLQFRPDPVWNRDSVFSQIQQAVKETSGGQKVVRAAAKSMFAVDYWLHLAAGPAPIMPAPENYLVGIHSATMRLYGIRLHPQPACVSVNRLRSVDASRRQQQILAAQRMQAQLTAGERYLQRAFPGIVASLRLAIQAMPRGEDRSQAEQLLKELSLDKNPLQSIAAICTLANVNLSRIFRGL